MLYCSAKLLHHLRQCPCYLLFVSYYYDVITIPLVGLGGVIGAMDNVQSFVVFFYGFPEPCGRKLKEQRYTQPLYSGADLATVLFSHVVES